MNLLVISVRLNCVDLPHRTPAAPYRIFYRILKTTEKLSHLFSDYLFWVAAVTTISSTKQFPRTTFANCATQRDVGFIVTMVTREILANSNSIRWGTKIIFDPGLQPRSQSSSAISDVTSPVKLVGKIRYRSRFQASSGHSDSANRSGYEAARP